MGERVGASAGNFELVGPSFARRIFSAGCRAGRRLDADMSCSDNMRRLSECQVSRTPLANSQLSQGARGSSRKTEDQASFSSRAVSTRVVWLRSRGRAQQHQQLTTQNRCALVSTANPPTPDPEKRDAPRSAKISAPRTGRTAVRGVDPVS